MSTCSPDPPLVATGDALAQVLGLLRSIDHDARKGLDADARFKLAELAVEVGRRSDALRAVLVAEADRARSGGPRGTSVTDLLSMTAQVTSAEVAGWLFAGKDVNARPAVQEATLAGDVSVRQARSIDKVLGQLPATLPAESRAEAERLMLQKATSMDAGELAKQTRAVLAKVAPAVDGVEDELTRLDIQRKQAFAARSFSMVSDGEGSIILKGQLPVFEGELLVNLVNTHSVSNRRAVEQAADRHDDPGMRTREQRTADGLIALVHSVHAGRGGASGAGQAAPTSTEHATPPPADQQAPAQSGHATPPGAGQAAPTSAVAVPASAVVAPASADGAPASADGATPASAGQASAPSASRPVVRTPSPTPGPGSSRNRPTVVVTMSMDLLVRQQEQTGRLASGRDTPAGVLRQLLCDCNILPVVLGAASEPLDVGRQQRLVTPGIRKALEARDRGCAFPRCHKPPSECEAHHINPWWAGGDTSLGNLVLLCPHHHGVVEPLRFWPGATAPTHWSVRMGGDGHPEFLPPARPGQSNAAVPVRHPRTIATIEDGRRLVAHAGSRHSLPEGGSCQEPPPEILPLD